MSEARRVVLVGSTGLVGRTLVARATDRRDIHLIAIARRPMPLPLGGKMTLLVEEPSAWPEAIVAEKPEAIVIALGTTRRAAGSEEAFRAVDQHLVLACAQAAKVAGARQCIAVSSVGANARSRNFYLRVKGEVEDALAELGFGRLDILRPGLLRGERAERRPAERLAMAASPLLDRFLHGPARRYRSIPIETVAAAILGLLGETAPGRFVHEHDAIRRAAR